MTNTVQTKLSRSVKNRLQREVISSDDFITVNGLITLMIRMCVLGYLQNVPGNDLRARQHAHIYYLIMSIVPAIV